MTEITAVDTRVAAMDARVVILEKDVAEVNSRLISMDEKFDKVMAGFAAEFRTSLSGLSLQFSERNKTPWGILISGAGVVVTLVAFLGHQALSPIAENLNTLRQGLVPRAEVELRYEMAKRRIEILEEDSRRLILTELDALRAENKRLQSQNDLLKIIKPDKN